MLNLIKTQSIPRHSFGTQKGHALQVFGENVTSFPPLENASYVSWSMPLTSINVPARVLKLFFFSCSLHQPRSSVVAAVALAFGSKTWILCPKVSSLLAVFTSKVGTAFARESLWLVPKHLLQTIFRTIGTILLILEKTSAISLLWQSWHLLCTLFSIKTCTLQP